MVVNGNFSSDDQYSNGSGWFQKNVIENPLINPVGAAIKKSKDNKAEKAASQGGYADDNAGYLSQGDATNQDIPQEQAPINVKAKNALIIGGIVVGAGILGYIIYRLFKR
jgi:hypothetical protein